MSAIPESQAIAVVAEVDVWRKVATAFRHDARPRMREVAQRIDEMLVALEGAYTQADGAPLN